METLVPDDFYDADWDYIEKEGCSVISIAELSTLYEDLINTIMSQERTLTEGQIYKIEDWAYDFEDDSRFERMDEKTKFLSPDFTPLKLETFSVLLIKITRNISARQRDW